MLSKLFTAIWSDGADKFGRQGTKHLNHSIANMHRCFLRNLQRQQ